MLLAAGCEQQVFQHVFPVFLGSCCCTDPSLTVFCCRVEMLQLYERCILMDIEFSDTQNVDQLLWKNAFYQVIEKFRQLLKDPQGENAQEIRNKLLLLLDEVRREKHPHIALNLWVGLTDF